MQNSKGIELAALREKQRELERQEEEFEPDEDSYGQSNKLDQYYQQYKEEKVRKHDIMKDGPATELSNDILSYERFYPGRILGNTFNIKNVTNESISIKVGFTREGIDREHVSKKLMEFYEVSTVDEIEQPYLNYLKHPFIDSQKDFECWYIEDPYQKTLVKEADYELQPGESFEFIIVLKSPIIKKTHFLTTNVRIRNLSHEEEH